MSDILVIEHGTALLFGTFVIEGRLVLLLLLVFAAMVFDIRNQRVPNRLVLAGVLLGFAFHIFTPYGWGVGYALQGAAVGFGLFVPLYILRAMGAGDVKLMAMVGTFLGPVSTLGAVLTTLIAGGVLAIAVALGKGVLPIMLANLRFMMTHAGVKALCGDGFKIEPLATAAAKLPYAIAIAAGTLTHVMLARSGHALAG